MLRARQEVPAAARRWLPEWHRLPLAPICPVRSAFLRIFAACLASSPPNIASH